MKAKLPTRYKHALAKLKRQGKGFWRVWFKVDGYDEEFLMHAPGNLSETFAVAVTRVALRNSLRSVALKHVHMVRVEMEPANAVFIVEWEINGVWKQAMPDQYALRGDAEKASDVLHKAGFTTRVTPRKKI